MAAGSHHYLAAYAKTPPHKLGEDGQDVHPTARFEANCPSLSFTPRMAVKIR
ncbi:MAG: hypothetical protein ACI8UO_002918 [Verrucomicrobiales bacterium]|jgi:hypothetical protein